MQIFASEAVTNGLCEPAGRPWVQQVDLCPEKRPGQVHPGSCHLLTILWAKILSEPGNQASPRLKFRKSRVSADNQQFRWDRGNRIIPQREAPPGLPGFQAQSQHNIQNAQSLLLLPASNAEHAEENLLTHPGPEKPALISDCLREAGIDPGHAGKVEPGFLESRTELHLGRIQIIPWSYLKFRNIEERQGNLQYIQAAGE